MRCMSGDMPPPGRDPASDRTRRRPGQGPVACEPRLPPRNEPRSRGLGTRRLVRGRSPARSNGASSSRTKTSRGCSPLAVFARGWTLEAAEVVCNRGDLATGVLEGIASLVDKSLVRIAEGEEGRFSMLETIRSNAHRHHRPGSREGSTNWVARGRDKPTVQAKARCLSSGRHSPVSNAKPSRLGHRRSCSCSHYAQWRFRPSTSPCASHLSLTSSHAV